ncbi:alpha/beta fold hydrolase [Lewinella cohaerens]|uniref:alpha/beta fold hydrolase n=1 Tax=Lewinella cohaerens TaxID=70995 RepID=UPI00036B4109|nr:alpha/beta fold hydrolase [Lewinella cohaerens]
MASVSSDLYPFKSHYLDIGGHRFHYLEEGKGDPVVLLHGNPSWSFYYRKLIPKLSSEFHCLAPDHIGMGYSDKPGDDAYNYTYTQRVKDLEYFLEVKGITDNITLIVHDWGGMIGMYYARRHPEAIKKIVLLNTAAFHLPKQKAFPFMLRFTRSFLGIFAVRAFNAFSFGATLIGVKRNKMPREVRRAYRAPYNSWKNRIATLRFVQDVPLKIGDPGFDEITDLQDHLHLFKDTPILIAWGLKDVVFDVNILEKWVEYLPHAQVHRFEDCGHYILEDAQEEVGKLIVDFLAH